MKTSTADRAGRQGGRSGLAQALRDSRADTLARFADWQRAFPDLRIPFHETLNPPLWELGHIGWFQEYWTVRNPQVGRGWRADPAATRAPARRHDADALYDSGRVAHAKRPALPLPGAPATLDDLRAQLDAALALLEHGDGSDDSDDALYFFRLALLHEDMHHEAALYMAQQLDVAVDDPRWQPQPVAPARDALYFAAGGWTLGHAGDGFAFDNEGAAHRVELAACAIDATVVAWGDYLPFVEAGGYADERWWSDAGRRWKATLQRQHPRYLRAHAGGWQVRRYGRWADVDPALPACHLSAHEAEAWCRWAGRRLPAEAEWERAAVHSRTGPDAFRWGQVWEWTASPFLPYPGFTPHPYRDYSAPWFGDRRVLRGASFMTQPRMRHPRYRNFFREDRDDIPAGFRSCAMG